MHARAVERLRLENDLRDALAHRELRLRYQPIRCLRRHRVVGFEALLRWQHPRQGLLTPAAFLSQVEETGLALEFGEWVLAEACRQVAWMGHL
jgi:EAL domain-containing protein (putative c-di-GMP-specific phosphodiesterase class I)